MKRFWMRWTQKTADYRPLNDPPNESILAWWCTGYDANDSAILVAGVRAESQTAAIKAITIDWPEASEWSIMREMEKPYKLSDRFPLKGWAKERWNKGDDDGKDVPNKNV